MGPKPLHPEKEPPSPRTSIRGGPLLFCSPSQTPPRSLILRDLLPGGPAPTTATLTHVPIQGSGLQKRGTPSCGESCSLKLRNPLTPSSTGHLCPVLQAQENSQSSKPTTSSTSPAAAKGRQDGSQHTAEKEHRVLDKDRPAAWAGPGAHPPKALPLPSLVLALRMGTGCGACWGLMVSGGAMVTVSTAAATAAAAAAAELPLKGLLALNSRHLAPRTVIILDMGIFGFFLAMSGLREGQGGG